MIGGAPWLTRRDYPKLVGGLEAWFDETDPSSMIMDSANRVSLIADKSGNSSVNVLCLNGVAGNYASAPDSAALSITGDIDLRAQVSLDDWTPASSMQLIAKDESGQRSYTFTVQVTTGNLVVGYSTDGVNLVEMVSSAAPTVSDFGILWVRVTLDVDNGAAGKTATFYTSNDGSTWTQLGSPQTTAGTISIANTTSVLQLGANFLTSNRLTGRIYRAQIYNGINGTLVFDADFSTAAKLAPSFTESSSNAATVTINTSGATGARISGARDRYQGTAASQQVYLPWSGTNYLYAPSSTAADTASTPDTAAFDAVAQLDIVVRVKTGWTSLGQRFFGKWASTGNLRSWVFGTNTGAAYSPRLYISGDGAVSQSIGPTVLLTAQQAAGPIWLRVTWRASDQRVQYFTAPDQESVPTSWTQLGADVTMSGAVATCFNNAEPIRASDGEPAIAGFAGNVYYASVATTIDAAPIVTFDPARYSSGTTFVAATGETWTLLGNNMIVTRSGLYSDAVDDYSKTPGFVLAQPMAGHVVMEQHTWTLNESIIDGAAAAGIYQSATTPNFRASGGVATTENTGWALRTCAVVGYGLDSTNSYTQVNRNAALVSNGGTSSPNGVTVAANFSASATSGLFTSESLFFSGRLSTTQRARLALWSARKHRLPAV